MRTEYEVQLKDTVGKSYIKLGRFPTKKSALIFVDSEGEKLMSEYNKALEKLRDTKFDRVSVVTIRINGAEPY